MKNFLFSFICFSLFSPAFAQQQDDFEVLKERARCASVYDASKKALKEANSDKISYFAYKGHQNHHFIWDRMRSEETWKETVTQVQEDFSQIATKNIIWNASEIQSLHVELMKKSFERAYKEDLATAVFFNRVINFLSDKESLNKKLTSRSEYGLHRKGEAYKKTTFSFFAPTINYKNSEIKSCVLIKRKGIDKAMFPVICLTFDAKLIAEKKPSNIYERAVYAPKLEEYVYQENEQGQGVYHLTFNGIDLLKADTYVAEQMKKANCPVQ